MAAKWRVRRGQAAALVTGLILLAGCQQEEAAPQRPVQPVKVVNVASQAYSRTIALTGEIAARNSTSLSFKTGGRVTAVEVDVGYHVAPGDILAKLDPAQQQAGVASAEAAVTSAEAKLKQARSTLERQQSLLKDGYTTRSSYDSAKEAVATAQGTLDSAQATLQTARTSLDDTVLKAEAAGVITSRSVEPGQVVSAAQAVLGFAEDGARDAVFDVQEQVLIHAKDDDDGGPTISIALLADPQVTTTGHVREISPLIDPQTGTVEVKVGLDAVPPQMSLGAAVVGEVTFLAAEEAFLLPWQALAAQDGQPAVWRVDPDTNVVSLTPIEIARYDSNQIVVASGLKPGDRVVTAGSQLILPGETIEAMEEQP
ncbi:efflux RND transporter periplasmic adaptor subunit [Consotaella aegiceratis]|uniref:efflux RND transporter periplasmic adaptor subunit n=1 Tax=Consotaella aegiceratis TaxID=3097961 RepID=UPI002F403225